MIRKSIKRLVAWAVKNRPPEYIQVLKNHCAVWNVEKDYYEISDENWDKIAKMFGGKVTAASQNKPISVGKSPCKYAVRDCCGKPYICSVDGGDCPDRFNDECVKRDK